MSWTSALLRLYPRSWRDRYEAELLAVLDQRASTIADRVDIARGALDAHLHPRLVSGEPEPPWTHRIPGVIAFGAGAIWTASVVLLLILAGPSADGSGLLVGSAIAMFLSLPGQYMTAHGRRIALGLGLVSGCAVVAGLLPWPLLAAPFLAMYLLVLAGMLVLAGIRAGIGAPDRWRLLIVAIGLPVVLVAPVIVGVAPRVVMPWLLAGILLPYGLAWTALGLRLLVRGSATFVDELAPAESEVSHA
jgi:hypothetical protein